MRAVFQNRVPGRKHLNWTGKRLSLGGGIGGRILEREGPEEEAWQVHEAHGGWQEVRWKPWVW